MCVAGGQHHVQASFAVEWAGFFGVRALECVSTKAVSRGPFKKHALILCANVAMSNVFSVSQYRSWKGACDNEKMSTNTE